MLLHADCAQLQGPEYSCFTIAHEGRVVAHADTTASLSNLNYAYKGVPDIRDWVTTFCNKTAISGQVRDFTNNTMHDMAGSCSTLRAE